jgi:molybdopterin converting factor small subunit
MTTILLFHTLREAAGSDAISLPIDKPLDADAFWELLLLNAPQLAPYRSSTRIACNQAYLDADAQIHPGDEVALIPPVSGG